MPKAIEHTAMRDTLIDDFNGRCARGETEDGDQLLCVLAANHYEMLQVMEELKEVLKQINLNGVATAPPGTTLQRAGEVARANAPPLLGGAGVVAIVLAVLERM